MPLRAMLTIAWREWPLRDDHLLTTSIKSTGICTGFCTGRCIEVPESLARSMPCVNSLESSIAHHSIPRKTLQIWAKRSVKRPIGLSHCVRRVCYGPFLLMGSPGLTLKFAK